MVMKRNTKKAGVEAALRLLISAKVKQTESLPVRVPIIPAGGRAHYTPSPQEIDDAVLV